MLKIAALLLALALPAFLRAEAKPALVASVGPEKIDAVEFNAKVSAEERRLGRKLSADERQGLLQSLINQRLMVAEAKGLGLAKKDELRRSVDDFERELLAKLLYDSEIAAKAQVSEAEAKKIFDANPGLFEIREAGQIVIEPKEGEKPGAGLKKAERLKAKLEAAPGSFSKMAGSESDDAKSKARGGDLGPLRRGMMLPELEAALFAAKPGAILGPIKTQFGFHILQLRSVKAQDFSQAKDFIAQQVSAARSAQLQKELLAELAKKYKVSISKELP